MTPEDPLDIAPRRAAELGVDHDLVFIVMIELRGRVKGRALAAEVDPRPLLTDCRILAYTEFSTPA
jgi:hypothetical protein